MSQPLSILTEGVALLQVVNDTQLRLEVALVEVQRRPSGRSPASKPAGFDRSDSLVDNAYHGYPQMYSMTMLTCSLFLRSAHRLYGIGLQHCMW